MRFMFPRLTLKKLFIARAGIVTYCKHVQTSLLTAKTRNSYLGSLLTVNMDVITYCRSIIIYYYY